MPAPAPIRQVRGWPAPSHGGEGPPPARGPAPAPRDALIGREGELDRLCTGDEAVRVLVGPAGVGKTRLARAVAEAGRAAGRRAVHVDLTGSRTARDVVRATAVAVDASVRGLTRALAALGPVRLVLDAADEVMGPLPSLLAEWTKACPDLRVLVTSRTAPEGMPAEELGPLSLGSEADPGDAERLFEACAARVRPGYRATEADREAVRGVVRRLGGLPLAVELAASWMGVLGPTQILERLGSGAALREVGDGDRCLDEVLEAAFAALKPVERRALAQLSCFRGGFDVEAAEAVVRVPARAGVPVMAVVDALRRRSMVCATGEPGSPDGVRLSLLPPIQRFAAARLAETADGRALLERHGRHYVDAAERWLAESGGVPTRRFHRRLRTELDNLRLAYQQALSRGDAELAVRASLAIAPLHTVGGVASVIVDQLDAVLGRDGPLDAVLRARALQARGVGKLELGRPADAREDQQAALAALGPDGSPEVRASVNNNLGLTAWLLGEAREARTFFEEGLSLGPPVGLRGKLLGNLGIALCQLGEQEAADRAYRDAARYHRQAGNAASEGCVLESRGHLCLRRGEPERALGHLRRALSLHEELDDLRHQGTTLGFVGLAHQELGRFDEAERCYREARLRQRRAGNEQFEGIAVGLLADLVRERGEPDEAAALYAEAIDLASATDDAWAAALFGCGLASVQAAAGRPEHAARSLEEARARADAEDDPALAMTLRLTAAQVGIARGPVDEGVADALRTLEEVEAGAPAGERTPFLRLAIRALRSHIDRVGTSGPTLTVEPEARWFRLDGEPDVSLARKALLRRILLRFVEERRAHPGQALTVDALREAGWPGERALPGAAKNRVYVAVATLRKLGLGDALVTAGDGYMLDPSVQVVAG